jgi:hypothetical protein
MSLIYPPPPTTPPPTTPLAPNISDTQNELLINRNSNIDNTISQPSLEISGINISRLYPTIRVESRKLSIEELNKSSNLTVFSYGDEYQEDHCSICSDRFVHRDIIRIIKKCNHVFHQSCIDRWFYDEKICAICRQDIRDHVPSNVSSSIQENNTLEEFPIHSTNEQSIYPPGEDDVSHTTTQSTVDDNIIPTYNISLQSTLSSNNVPTSVNYYDGYSDVSDHSSDLSN